jgi:glycosyltransferase involved in cell wall biosynthesis
VYAGGLHYNRWKVLSQIAMAIKEMSQTDKCKGYLKIYSAQSISDEIIDNINIEGVSEFCGAASASQIAEIYSNADVLLHVESFESKAIASTKYSFSTKIPEYLSAGKCILAVGPAEIASLRYLSQCACVVNDSEELALALEKILSDSKYRELIKTNCEEQYKKDFSREKQRESLERIIQLN